MHLVPGRRYRIELEFLRVNPETGMGIFNVVGMAYQVEMASIDQRGR